MVGPLGGSKSLSVTLETNFIKDWLFTGDRNISKTKINKRYIFKKLFR